MHAFAHEHANMRAFVCWHICARFTNKHMHTMYAHSQEQADHTHVYTYVYTQYTN